MNLTAIEWSQAQDLLLKLVQILSPLAERDAPISTILNKRFFIPPPISNDAPLDRSVRLLTTLHSVQKQVEEIIGVELPAKEIDLLPKSASEKQKPKIVPEQILAKQAKKLIDQVQDAIGKLCHSTNIKDPQEEPLLEVLKHLKPNLDQIIEGISHEEIHSENTPLPPKNLIAKRELQIANLKWTKPTGAAGASPHPVPVPVPVPDPLSSLSSLEQLTSPIKQDPPQEIAKPLARNVLPATSLIPPSRQLTPARKKKKRKGFWFRDDDEDQKA